MTEVTQVDLDAAAELIEAYWSGADASMMRLAKDTRNGHRQGAFPRAFARHRESALATARAEAAAIRERCEALEAALRPFADCCDQISEDEDDEEWAKFRLLIKDYRTARAALTKGPTQ